MSVTDGEYTDSQIITVTVSPVNDAPVLDAISDQNMNEGGTKVLLLSASDVDEDVLVYSITDGCLLYTSPSPRDS